MLQRPLIGRLLAHAATGVSLGPLSGKGFAWRESQGDERQLRWVLQSGLGALLHHATRDCADVVPLAWAQALHGAELTALVVHGTRVDTMLEVLDACDTAQVRATLLKGISVSEQLWPAEHMRPMADLDVLIPAHAYQRVESALLERGYDRLDEEFPADHQHGAPLVHRRRRTIVELHTGLFRADPMLREGSAFDPTQVAARSVASHYHGRPVLRLCAELQLAYIGTSLFDDLTQRKVSPSFVATLFDAVYLLTSLGPTLDWRAMLKWLDNDMAKASLYAVATYLPRFGVEPAPPGIVAQLAATQSLVGPVQLCMIHTMLERYLVGGRYWDLPLPPPVPGRYSVLHQLKKRLARPGHTAQRHDE
jgi:hypothetical protein